MELSRFAPAARLDPLVKGPGAGEADVLQALRHLGDRGFIRFHPALAERLGHKAALLLGLALYWTRYTMNQQPQRQGWFHMTAHQWKQATGLSGREQSTARVVLVRQRLWQESLSGRPAMLHFWVDLAKVAAILGRDITTAAPEAETHPVWSSNCVCYYKPLADLTGNVACGLYLSHLLQLQRKAVLWQQVRPDALRVSQDDVSIALCLGPKVQRNARERLRRAGLIRESGPSLVVLNLPAIMACLQAQEGRLLPRGRTAVASPTRSLTQLPVAASVAADQADAPDANHRHPIAPLLGAFAQMPLGLLSLADSALASAHGATHDSSTRPSSALRASLLGAHSLPCALPSHIAPNLDAAAETMSGRISTAGQGRTPDCMTVPAPFAESAKLGGAGAAESAKLKLPKTQPHISISISNTTTTHTQEPPPCSLAESGKPRCRRIFVDSFSSPKSGTRLEQAPQIVGTPLDQLVYPASLDPTYLPGVRSVLTKARTDHRQALLDELDGQLRTKGKTIHNPAGWLMAVIRQQRQDGTVVFAMAGKIAADREHRLRVQKQVERARQGHTADIAAPEPAKTANPAVMAAAREKLLALKAEFVAKRGQL